MGSNANSPFKTETAEWESNQTSARSSIHKSFAAVRTWLPQLSWHICVAKSEKCCPPYLTALPMQIKHMLPLLAPLHLTCMATLHELGPERMRGWGMLLCLARILSPVSSLYCTECNPMYATSSLCVAVAIFSNLGSGIALTSASCAGAVPES